MGVGRHVFQGVVTVSSWIFSYRRANQYFKTQLSYLAAKFVSPTFRETVMELQGLVRWNWMFLSLVSKVKLLNLKQVKAKAEGLEKNRSLTLQVQKYSKAHKLLKNVVDYSFLALGATIVPSLVLAISIRKPVLELVTHFMYVGGVSLSVFVHLTLTGEPQEYARLWNHVVERVGRVRKGLSLQNLVLLGIPGGWYGMAVLLATLPMVFSDWEIRLDVQLSRLGLLELVDSEGHVLLYWVSNLALFWLVTKIAFLLHLGLVLILTFFEVQYAGYQETAQNLRNARPNLESCGLQCRRLQLGTRLFNNTHAKLLWVFKLVTLATSILCTSIVVVRGHELEYWKTVMFTYLAAFVFGMYNVMLWKAFNFPEGIREVKQALLLAAEKNSKGQLRWVEGFSRSVPEWGIKDGGFRFFERVTPLVMFDFYVVQVVNIVLLAKSLV